MTTEAQRIAIATACGWKPTTDGGICWDNKGCAIFAPPDYPNDLNAAHEMEKALTSAQQEIYACLLADRCNRFADTFARDGFRFIHATAAQRAESFLRVLNLWEDDK